MGAEATVAPPQNAKPRPPAPEKVPQEQQPSVLSRQGLASILVPCCGQLEYTKLCVPSVLLQSRHHPIELIFIDIGSLDGTIDYLTGLYAGLQGRVRVEVLRAEIDMEIGDREGAVQRRSRELAGGGGRDRG